MQCSTAVRLSAPDSCIGVHTRPSPSGAPAPSPPAAGLGRPRGIGAIRVRAHAVACAGPVARQGARLRVADAQGARRRVHLVRKDGRDASS
jgi:hypothetical protein